MIRTKKAQGAATPWAFWPFLQGGLFLGLVAVIAIVQPLTDVVGNYTCHNRQQIKGFMGSDPRVPQGPMLTAATV